LGEIRLGEMGVGEMGLGEMGQNHRHGHGRSQASATAGTCCSVKNAKMVQYRYAFFVQISRKLYDTDIW